ncbi:MAG: non-ribosomal peptide synthetase [Blastocatellia bacterium AA13]|nr:MAG: non-ribosomal peptide synthetase [Blastocatellia bacterium AA13]
MSVTDLIAELSSLGIRLWVDGDQLRFKAPRGTLTPDLKERLVRGKAELIRFLLDVRQSGGDSAAPAIRRAPREALMPLSFAQERLWFIDQWEPGNVAYNIYDAIIIEGKIDVPALEQSLNEIVRRHEILRTTFVMCDEQPAQQIAASLTLMLPMIGLEGIDVSAHDALIERLIGQEISSPFDLATGPLLRVKLFRLGSDKHVLLFNLHHIVSDGWTTGVLIKEMAALYGSYTMALPSPLPELPIQYADFAVWQRETMTGERLAAESEFWKERLKGAPTSLELPTDRPRPAARTYLGAVHEVVLPRALSSQVRRFSQQERITPFMVLLAAWNALLAAYSGQEDIVVGSAHANRSRSELEDLIGFFVNALVLRTDLSGNPRFIELVERVRETTLSAQEHQDLPFEKLVEDLQIERDLSRTPLYQVALVFQNAPTAEMSAPGLLIRRLYLPTDTSKFDITFTITDSEPSLTGEIEYSLDLFEPATIALMAGHFQTILAAALASPHSRISSLPLLSETEQHQLLVDWNAPPVEYRDVGCAHELFELQVERTPDAPALVFEDRHLTYRELNSRANRLAHYLRQSGTGPGSVVGMFMERSIELMVGLVGILKSGGAYLPMDPKYPPDRVSFMLNDADLRVLLIQSHLAGSLPDWEGRTLALDTDWNLFESGSDENPRSEATAADLAYVIYTSGSTGNPKGVMVTHGSLVSYACTAGARYEISPTDRVLQFCSISFDISGEEIYPCLSRGAALVLRTDGMLESIPTFLQKCEEWNLTFMSLPTAYWNEITASLGTGDQSLPGPLRMVIIAGESALPERLAIWQRHAMERVRLINTYGPTEATISVTMCELTGISDGNSLPDVSIGRVITDAEIYVLNRELNPVPVVVPGEVYIGGDLLARGYHNRPELTAELFVPSSFSDQSGARMYKTGDLVRYMRDGNLRFAGRVDQQVKIRGFRVELEEIETLLLQHVGVKQAVVAVRENADGSKALVGYLVPTSEQAPTSGEIRTFLKERLPDYMVPARFVTLDQVPLTPNGKVDRKALPSPEEFGVDDESEYVAPRTPVQQLLASFWSEMLQVARVGVNDNFFDLGGHSLLATRLASRVRAAFHVDVPLRVVFETPTVAGLAAAIETAMRLKEGSEWPAIEPISRESDLPVSYAQQRLWFLDQLEPDNPFYNISGAIQLNGALNVEALERSLSEVVRRHEPLRTSFIAVNGEPLQRIEQPWPVALEATDLSGASDCERNECVNRLVAEDAQQPFKLDGGRLFRARVLRVGDDAHILLLTLHHIISDGLSLNVLIGEIAEIYRALIENRAPALPDLAIQYADYAVWQRRWLQGDELQRRVQYWKEHLAGAPPSLDLPLDHSRPAVLSYRGRERQFQIPAELADSLIRMSRAEGVTLFMLLLAGFKSLLLRYTGQSDIVVGTPIAYRDQVELEPLIGFFVNTVVLRTDLSGRPAFRDVLRRVREVALAAYMHQDVPFEKLVEELQPERNSGRSPIFQVSFGMEQGREIPAHLSDLELTSLEAPSGTSKFELTLALEENAGRISGSVEYNTDLFEEPTVIRMIGHYLSFLENAVESPDSPVAALSLLSQKELQQTLVEWNDSRVDYEPRPYVHELIQKQAEIAPDRLAVEFNGDQVTYRQLNAQANQLAHYLQRVGVGADVLVSVCLERSVEMVVALLGVMKRAN